MTFGGIHVEEHTFCTVLMCNLNLTLKAGYWRVYSELGFRKDWRNLKSADCSVCGGIKQLLSVNLKPAAVFAKSGVFE